jgi:hypothetical protein
MNNSRTRRYSLITVLGIALILLAMPTTLLAQFLGVQYGPRAFAHAPVGTRAIDMKVDYMEVNINIDIDGSVLSGIDNTSKAVYVSYVQYFEFFGKTASVLGAIPLVDIKSTIATNCCGSFPGLSVRGLTDPFVQFNIGLIGQQAMDAKEFFTTEPGFAMTLHTGVRLPFGKYDSNSPLNPGSNRFEYRMGLPMSYTWGTPTKQTSIELSPVFYFFDANSKPFGASRLSQDPALQIEAHIVHDFSPAFWASFNALRVRGGKTTKDGVKSDNPLDYAGVGFSFGGRLSRNWGYSFSYGQRYNSKNEEDDGGLIRAGMTFTF